MSLVLTCIVCVYSVFCFQAEDGIRDLVRSRGLGDVYKRQEYFSPGQVQLVIHSDGFVQGEVVGRFIHPHIVYSLSLIHI